MRTYVISGASQLVPLTPSPYIYYRGFSLRETAGAPATIIVYDSLTAAGTVIDEIDFSPNESVRENYGNAKTALIGLYISVVSGTVAGSINFD